MKKKILMMLTMAALLVCFFAVSASAAITIYDDFDVTALENIEYRSDDIVVFDDGFSCPSVYVFKDTKSIGKGQWSSPDGLKNAIDFEYINSKVGKQYTFDDIDSFDIPQGVTSMGQYACNSLKTIRKISIPDTVVSFGGPCFQNASGLEYCIMEHSENSTLTTFPGTMFSASGLKAFSMPDCITTLPSGNEFGNCKSLTAVYLSKNLTSITGTNNNSCFDYCGKLYLVNDPFVATSEEQIPAKPSIYYFPSNLTALGTDSQGIFRGSNSINDVLVFGEKLTAITSRVAFQNCPANTVVFLGDMTDVIAYNNYYWGTQNFIFANPNDKSASDLNLALKSDRNAYFCYGEGTANHIKELSKTTEASCTLPAMTADFCFCGQLIPNTETTVGGALGHSHTIYLGVFYENYTEEGYKKYECDRCGNVSVDEKSPELFVCLGYSSPEDGGGEIVISYMVNNEALNEYTAYLSQIGKTLKYGVFAVAQQRLGDSDIFGNDGTVVDNAVVAEISGYEFSAFDLKIVGFTDEHKDTMLAIGAYVKETDADGKTVYSYMQYGTPNANEKYCFVSYNDVVGKHSTEEDVIQ